MRKLVIACLGLLILAPQAQAQFNDCPAPFSGCSFIGCGAAGLPSSISEELRHFWGRRPMSKSPECLCRFGSYIRIVIANSHSQCGGCVNPTNSSEDGYCPSTNSVARVLG